MDDLKIDQPATAGVLPTPPSEHLREIGPESEVRGGPEAPSEAPTDAPPPDNIP